MLVGFDIETSGDGDSYGLQPNRVRQGAARITSAAFVTENGETAATLNPSLEFLRENLQAYAGDDDTYLVGHNTQFDVAWLIASGLEEEVRACRWLDTEVLRRAIENDTTDKRYGLKPTVAKYLPAFAGYESIVAGDFDKIDDELLRYNILDAALTVRLAKMFLDELSQDHPRTDMCFVICEAILPVAKAWVEGIEIDTDALDKWEARAAADRDSYFAEFVRLAGITPSEIDIAKQMLTSPVKLKTFLRAKGFPVEKTDRIELSKYKHVPMIQAISQWKRENTAVSKFITSIRKSLSYNGSTRTHPACRLWNTYTGRFGYTSTTTKKRYQTGIAIHQFPRNIEARNCITAPQGSLLVELDFATQESRLLCDFSKDPVLKDIFDSGKDFHTYMAAIIDDIAYEDMIDRIAEGDKKAKEHRQLAKIVNLSCAYRTGYKKLIDVGRTQYDVIFDERTAKRLHGLFRDTYKQVPVYWDTAIFEAKSKGFAESRSGRRVYIDDWSRANSWSSESTAINFPIQATGADMKFLAISETNQLLRENGGRYMLDLHDAMFVILPDRSRSYDVAKKMQEICSNLPYKDVYGWEPYVKLPIDLKVGKAWGSLKEIK